MKCTGVAKRIGGAKAIKALLNPILLHRMGGETQKGRRAIRNIIERENLNKYVMCSCNHKLYANFLTSSNYDNIAVRFDKRLKIKHG